MTNNQTTKKSMNRNEILRELSGPITKTIYHKKPTFFNRIQTKEECAYRVLSPVAGPVLFTAATVECIIGAVLELLSAIANTCTGKFSKAKENMKESGGAVLAVGVCFLSIPASIIVNLLDLLVTAGKHLFGSKEKALPYKTYESEANTSMQGSVV